MSSNEKNKSAQPSLLSQWKNRSQKKGVATGIEKRPAGAKLHPSSGQKRLWLLQQLYPENPFYQYAHIYSIKGKLDVSILLESFQYIVDRQDILRSNYVTIDDEVLLNISSRTALSFEQIDLSDLAETEKNNKTATITKRVASATFDLQQDLLLQICLIKLSETEHHLILSIHHIIGDRESLLLLNKEVFTCYNAFQKKQRPELSALPIQYPDYSYWQNEQPTKEKDLDYWRQQLSGELPLLNLPLKGQRPKQSSFRGRSISRQLPALLSKQIHQLAKELSSTPYVLLLSAFKLLLFRYTDQTDILVGSPFGNRDKVALEKLIGFFNETLVLRTPLSRNWSFSELVTSIKKTTMDALEHKQVSFDELIRELQPERHGSANPIFQVMFLYNNIITSAYDGLDLEIEETTYDLGVSKFDLTLFITEYSDYLEMTMEFALDLFDENRIAAMLQHLENLLTEIVQDPNQRIDRIPLLDEIELKKMTVDWNKTDWKLPHYKGIHQLIEEMATAHPNQLAVVFQSDQITYAELSRQSSLLANLLLEKGCYDNEIIGLYAERSIAMIVGIIGILKAGAAYLPLDPSYPKERIQYMLEDANVHLMVSSEHLKKGLEFSTTAVLTIEEALVRELAPNTLFPTPHSEKTAYLIYTSGSTGQPKGVPISHSNLLHSTLARFSFYPSKPAAFLLLSSFSFDSSVVGIFWTLCSGGTLVLPQQRIEQDLNLLSELIAKHRVTHTLLLPSLYSMVLQHAPVEKLQSLTTVMVAGEACPMTLINSHFSSLPSAELYNEYGPTEASVWCIAHQIRQKERSFIPIGKPIPNATAFILDQEMQPVPAGVSGELFIGGLGLSKGYLNQPSLTSDRFLPSPFSEKERLYKTGDLARYQEDGVIEFLGRVDQQVKIRGFRVEPEEIQKVLLQNESVKEALVLVQETTTATDSQQRLVAYLCIVPDSNPTETINQIKGYLKDRLPVYMVPAVFVPLVSFPRLPNGKIDRKQLLVPKEHAFELDHNFEAPQSSVQIELANIWEEVLNLKQIGIKDNFFSIGGDSILSIQIVAKARAAGIVLSPTQLFEHQTIASLARSIENSETNITELAVQNNTSIEEMDNPTTYPLTRLQQAFLFNSKREGKDQGQLQLEFTISVQNRLNTDLPSNIDIRLFQEAWQLTAERHDIMRAFIKNETGQTPIQTIGSDITIDWQVEDWSEKSSKTQQKDLASFKEKDQNQKMDLNASPLSRMALFQLKPNEYRLIWSCHHLFLDGWSCGIILKEALSIYEELIKKQIPKPVPSPNYFSFLKWKSNQNTKPAEAYWKKELADFDRPLLFQPIKQKKYNNNSFTDRFSSFDKEQSLAISTYCGNNQISLSTFFQGVWAILLGEYFQSTDVVYGLTVSGRFANFNAIESISGLFMNTIPNRFFLYEKGEKTGDWLRSIQKAQGEKSKHEGTPLESIGSFLDWPPHTPMFDSLFVFGNFLKDGLTVGDLVVEDFQGGFSSAYPLTIRINPTDSIGVDWLYDRTRLTKKDVDWFEAAFQELSLNLTQAEAQTTTYELTKTLTLPLVRTETQILEPKTKQKYYNPPQNQVEATLSMIWKNLFELEQISVTDHYFELGGTSLMAIQLFAEIEQAMNQVLAPSTLFKHPTISQLAKLIHKTPSISGTESSLVPLRATGDHPPLFCLHGGGAHVFFYQGLSKHLSENQPVYSLQPPGLDGQSARMETIEAMAQTYIQEIQAIQPKGPYYILGTCFSNAVALEMAVQLLEKGEQIGRLFIIDSAPVHLFGDDPEGKSKTFVRFYDMLSRGDFSRIRSKIMRRLKPSEKATVPIPTIESESQKNLRLTIDSLNKLYADYYWKPYSGKIHFIQSSEFQQRADKKYHITQWKKLAKEGLETYVVAGHHETLFEEPEVRGLAKQIASCLDYIEIRD